MVEDSFNAAHQLKGYEGPCENLHGHTWKVRVFLCGDAPGPVGMLVDFRVIKDNLKDAIKDLDHSNLNDNPNFRSVNPTSENLAKLIFERLKMKFGDVAKVSKVTVFESPGAGASYYE